MRRQFIGTLAAACLFIGMYFLLNAASSITGLVILERVDQETSSIVGIVLVSVSIFLFVLERTRESTLEKRVAETKSEIHGRLRSGRIGPYRELINYALQLGLDVREGPRHIKVYRGGSLVTQIPRHPGREATGTYRKVLKRLYKEVA